MEPSEIQLTPLDLAPLEKLREQICALESMDLRVADYEVVRECVRAVMLGHLAIPHAVRTPAVFRARIGGLNFTSTSELWYPPAHLVTKIGRSNDVKESMFYCSDRLDVAVLEVAPRLGDLVTVLEAAPINPEERLLLLEIGIVKHAQNHGIQMQEKGLLYGSRFLREALTRSGRRQRVELIDNFLVRQFTKRVAIGSECEYKISLAISQLHRLPLLNATPQLDGIWYPSVAMQCTGTNIAMRPSAADALLKPTSCNVFHVADQTGSGLVLRRVRGPAPIGYDGRILW